MPIRRPQAAPPAAPASSIDIGLLGTYAGGFTLPEGDYMMDFTVRNGNPHANPPGTRLGVLVNCTPITPEGAPKGEPQDTFISMGSKAEHSFAPDPETGKGVVAIPGGAGGALNNKTNWFYFLKSLYDAGLPQGVFVNDFSVLDGIWVHAMSVPEPEDRKNFGAKTGEAAQEERQGSGMMPIVTAILDGGKPWEGGGGLAEAAPAAKPVARMTPKGTGAPKAASAPAAVEAEGGDEAVLQAAINGAATVLEKLAPGKAISNLQLRTQTFAAVSKAEGAEMAQAVQNEIFGKPNMVAAVLENLGFENVGGQIKAKA